MVLFPWGSPAMGFLPGEGLPYGIISAGTISHLLPYHEICVGELYHMVLPPPPPRGSSDIGFLPGEGFPYGIPSGGRLPYGIISGGGGGRIPM